MNDTLNVNQSILSFEAVNSTYLVQLFMGNENASDSTGHQKSSSSLTFIILTTLILTTIIISTVVGNILVIAAVLLERNLRTPANHLVLSLAVADLFVAILVMPFGAFADVNQEWSLGEFWCEVWTSADVLCCTASILHLLAIAVDRYWAVTNVEYIHQRNASRIGSMIGCVWIVAAIVSMAPIFGWKDHQFKYRIEVEKRCLVSQELSYQIFATVATFYGPLVLILALYWKIYQVARKRIRRRPGAKQVSNSQSSQPIMMTSPSEAVSPTEIQMSCKDLNSVETELDENLKFPPQKTEITTISVAKSSLPSSFAMTQSSNHSLNMNNDRTNIQALREEHSKNIHQKRSLNSKRERKAAKTLAIVTGVFVICWLPFFVVALLLPLCDSCHLPQVWLSIFLWLGYVNSLLNCIIYTIFSPDFRTAFKKILCGRRNQFR